MNKKQKTLQEKKDEEAFRKMKVIQIVNRMKRQVYLHLNRAKAQTKSTEQKQLEKQTGQRRKLEILQRPKPTKPAPSQPFKKY